MGAAATVIMPTFDLMSSESWADPTAKQRWHQVDDKINLICDTERVFLIGQGTVMFRKHDEIVRVVCGKSKKQLHKLVHGDLTTAKLESLGGGAYAKFLGLLPLQTLEVMAVELDTAIGGVGCHEETLAMVLASCDNRELQALTASFQIQSKSGNSKSQDLLSTITGKTKRNSTFQKFLLRVLACDRNDDTIGNTDVDLASAQAQQIHAFGVNANTIGVKDDPIIEILARASRSQCSLINAAYNKINSMSLTTALQSKFTGAAQLALCMWCLPVPDALAFLLNFLSSSSDASIGSRVLARYEKPFLSIIEEACRRNYNAGIFGLLQKSLSGNIAKAVVAWVNASTPDGGNEALFDASLEEQMSLVRSQGQQDMQHILFAVVGDAGHCATLSALLSQTDACLEKYIHEHMPQLVREPAPAPAPAPAARQPQRQSVRHKIEAAPDLSLLDSSFKTSFNTNLTLVEEYLNNMFHKWDTDCMGSLPADTFWQFYASLPLSDFGYTSDEIVSMRDFVEWEHDGIVVFDEIKYELADSIIDSLHEKKVNVKHFTEILAASNPPSTDQSSSLPPDLLRYLHDTFDSYDLDSSGSLEWNEFWQFIAALNIGISEFDFARVQADWDEDHDGTISWKEGLRKLTTLLSKMMEARQDYYIGLVDKETQLLFWYNLRDQSSSWMSEDDQAAYKAHSVEDEQAAAREAAADAASRQKRHGVQPVNSMLVRRRSVRQKKGTAQFVP